MNRLKNPVYFIIIILTCVLLFSSCNNTIKNVSTEIPWDDGTATLIHNNAVDFYFYYPENWIIDRNDAMITVYLNVEEVLEMDKQEPISNENFIVRMKPNLSATVFAFPAGKYNTVDEYWKNYGKPGYEEIFQDVESESEEDLTIDGASAKKYTFTLSLSGMKYKISQVIFFNRNQVYALTYTATENKYSTHINVLNTAVETFKFK